MALARRLLWMAYAVPLVAGAQARGSVAFVDVTVLPMDRERALPSQTVVVANGVITAMGRVGQVPIPRDAMRIDGRRRFLMPGLVDTHIHVSGNRQYDEALLTLFVANGVTTVLIMRGAPDRLQLRADVASAKLLGPRIYTVGPYVNEPFVRTPEEVERAVVEQKHAGYDFIKMHGDLSADAYARLNAVARREGIRVIGHAPRNLGIDPMFRERQYAVVHAEEYIYNRDHTSRRPSAVAAEVPDRARKTAAAGIWLMPNLTAFKSIGEQLVHLDSIMARPEMRLLPADIRESWGRERNPYVRRIDRSRYPHFVASYRVLEQITREFHREGVRLLTGTDALNVGVVPGFSIHDELRDLVTAGLTPFEALRAATSNAAAFFSDPRSGTVATGQRADLILLDRNPLTDIGNTRSIVGVMLDGRWIRGDSIRAMLRGLSPTPVGRDG